jgi:hypothetical protein
VTPPWWNQGGAAWGIYRSHQAIIEWALNDGVRRLLILEDDAEPVEGFCEKVSRFLEALPADNELVYLGGQTNHIKGHEPRQVNAEVIRPWSCNRLHAFAMNQAGMRKVYRYLTAHNWQTGHHIDHHLERLSRGDPVFGTVQTYAPTTWLINQAAGYSEIYGRHLRHRSFDQDGNRTPMVLAVLGPYRSGTSAVAGSLHKLGILMGHKFFQGGQHASPKGCFEAQMLYDLCMTCYPEPRFDAGCKPQQRINLLRTWMLGRRNDGAIIGAKHPKLCLMVPEMLAAWPECRFVRVQRPIEKSIDSLRKLGWWSQAISAEDLTRRLVETRDRDLANVPPERVLDIDFDAFTADPRTHLEQVAAFAEIEPTPEQMDRAIAHLDRRLDHHSQPSLEKAA